MSRLVLICFGLLSSLSLYAGNRCELGESWETVDRFHITSEKFASPQAADSNQSATFVAGYALDSMDRAHWIVRRSLDRGKSWIAVDDFLFSPQSNQNVPAGVAADSRNKTVYVGGASSNSVEGRSIIRKSTDNGETWKTIDESPLPTLGGIFDAAVDGNGIAYFVYRGFADRKWRVRRYNPETGKFSIVDTYSVANKSAIPSAVAATETGEVFVAGLVEGGNDSVWVVRYSENGKTDWKEVDRFTLDGTIFSGAIGIDASRNGKVVVVGQARDKNGTSHWVARFAYVDQPKKWKTIDAVPVEKEEESAFAIDAAIVEHKAGGKKKASPAEIFVVGNLLNSKSQPQERFIVRRGSNQAGSFELSEDILGRAETITNGARGDVFTAGQNSGEWFVRRLKCE